MRMPCTCRAYTVHMHIPCTCHAHATHHARTVQAETMLRLAQQELDTLRIAAERTAAALVHLPPPPFSAEAEAAEGGGSASGGSASGGSANGGSASELSRERELEMLLQLQQHEQHLLEENEQLRAEGELLGRVVQQLRGCRP